MQTHPYDALTPDCILDAVETTGLRCDGRLLELNSFENRVYQIGTEGDDGRSIPVIGKFYRPGRWSDAAIREEHAFARELTEAEIPLVAPLADEHGETLHRHAGFRFAIWPRRGGRSPDLEQPEVLERIGQFIARIHQVGAARVFRHREVMDLVGMAAEAREDVLASERLPPELAAVYSGLADDIRGRLEDFQALLREVPAIRLHGDTHRGNLLWTDAGPHFVDLDDARTGPAIQDLWMFLSGDPSAMTAQLLDLLEGYESFRPFDRRELALIAPLRTVRILRHAAWLASRADDPAFVQGFPVFYTPCFWEEHILALREQRAALDDPPLALP